MAICTTAIRRSKREVGTEENKNTLQGKCDPPYIRSGLSSQEPPNPSSLACQAGASTSTRYNIRYMTRGPSRARTGKLVHRTYQKDDRHVLLWAHWCPRVFRSEINRCLTIVKAIGIKHDLQWGKKTLTLDWPLLFILLGLAAAKLVYSSASWLEVSPHQANW